MAVMTTNTFSQNNRTGVKLWWGQSYKMHPKEYDLIFDKVMSDGLYEIYVGMVGTGLVPVKAESEAVSFDALSQGFTITATNVEYGLGFKISDTAIKDGRGFKLLMAGTKALARSHRVTKEYNGANVLNRAFQVAYPVGDALELCSAVHLNAGGAGGTYQNELSTAADLSEYAMEQAGIDINSWEDDRGLPAAIKTNRLIIPPALEYEAERFTESALRPGVANNDINAIRSTGMFPGGYAVNHYLTDSAAWFIKTDCDDGMIYQEREKDNFDDDREWDTNNACYKGTGRYVFLCVNPRGIYGSPGE